MSTRLREEIEARRRIYLVRHGEVSYFDDAGRAHPPDSVSLNTEGRAHAEALARALQDLPIDRAVSSGLARARETAEIIIRGRGLDLETAAPLKELTAGRLRDLDLSGFAGSPEEAFERAFIGALGGGITPESRFLGGEAYGDFRLRVLDAFRGLLATSGWRHLLVVAHGGTNRVILLEALGASLAGMGRLEQDAGCLNIIDVTQDGGLLVRLVNHTAHEPLKRGLRMTTMEKIYLDHSRTLASLRGGGEE
jgi:probable phosphoglycerate mutase